jgi:hypothetical protein
MHIITIGPTQLCLQHSHQKNHSYFLAYDDDDDDDDDDDGDDNGNDDDDVNDYDTCEFLLFLAVVEVGYETLQVLTTLSIAQSK